MVKNIVLLFFFSISFFAQAQEPVSIHLSEKSGLHYKEFYDIFEDDKGFIWLCANKGLLRYDGKKFERYTHPKQRGLSVFGVKQDNIERIWCQNISGQFFYIQDNKMHLFIDLKEHLRGELPNFSIYNNSLLLFCVSKIYKINLKTKVIELPWNNNYSLSTPLETSDGIFFTNQDSLVNISEGSFKKILPTNLPKQDKNGELITLGKSKIFKNDSSLFLLESRFGLNMFFRFNIAEKSLTKMNGVEALADKLIYTSFENNNEIWFGTNYGVWVYEIKDDNFQLKKQFLKDKEISKILKDQEGNYFFTTLHNGIYVVPNMNIEDCQILEENEDISSLDIVNDSTLIFGTNTGIIGVYNTTTNTKKYIDTETKGEISTLKYHKKNNVIFISKPYSAFTLHYSNFELEKIDDVNDFFSVKSLAILKNDDLLLTGYRNVKVFEEGNLNKNIHIYNKRTYASYYDKNKDEVYIAFVDNLVKYDSLWQPTIIQHQNKALLGKSITQMSNAIVWFASLKNGIYGIKNDSILYHYTTENGLISNNVEQIEADKNTLWIALDNGVQIFDFATQNFKTLTKQDGIISYDISGIEILKNKVYLSSDKGLLSIDKYQKFRKQNNEIYFNTFQVNDRDTIITSTYKLEHYQNSPKIGFNVNGFSFNSKGRYKYRLKGLNENWSSTDIGINSVNYNSLPAGSYTFQVYPISENQKQSGAIKELSIIIHKAFWQTWWFRLGTVVVMLGGTIMFFKNKIRKKEKERIAELEKISLEKEVMSINLMALRSQMNPHFIFNVLNSIQDLVLQKDTAASYDYIVTFSKLIRNTLSYSHQDFIPIEKELTFLNVYLKLEKLRFGDSFNYAIHSDIEEAIKVPSLVIQPFIENALIHGLIHKQGEKNVTIRFKFEEESLKCIVTDNGIGRKKAHEINARQENKNESFALIAIQKRLDIFKKQYGNSIGYVIEDLYTNEKPIGTKITLTLPFDYDF